MELHSVLGDSNSSMKDVLERVRRFQTHEINQQRQIYGEYHHLFPILKKYPDKFLKYTRMDLDTFDYILSEIEEKLVKQWCNLHQAIYPEEQFVLTLRFLATGSSYSQLAFSFRMGDSTVCETVKNVMNVLWEVLQPIHMPVPNEDSFREIANDFFEKWKMPHCLGAIDCRHMRIKQPAYSDSLFFNWKHFYSIKLQAVVDANYRFIFIDAGDYGKTHDSTTFTNSKLFKCLKYGKIKFLKDDELPDSGIILPYYFIGDGAYMLQEHLMKPYRGKNLSVPERTFNERLSSARMVVECAFGHLVQTWRIFLTTMGHNPETATLITKCACVLRNVIIDMKTCKQPGDDSMSELPTLTEALVGDKEHDQDFIIGHGKEVRDELTKYFMGHPVL